MLNFLEIQKRPARSRSWVSKLVSPVFALGITLLVSSVLLIALGYPPLQVFYSFFIEPLTSAYDFSEVVMRASILAIIALGLAVGFRANIWNIGAEGQFIMGAVGGSLVALFFHEQDGWYIIPLMILAGILGGIGWASIPAFLKNRFNASEILTSLMLVYIAQLLLNYLVHGPLKDPGGLNFPQSVYFSDSATYPYLVEGTRLSITPLLLLLLLPCIYLLMIRSYPGFQLRVQGFSDRAARYGGFNSKAMVFMSFALCGALAGLAGISEVSSNIGQLIPVISPGFGFTAIIVAFLGGLHPVGIIFSALLIALIYIGAETAQISIGLPISMGGIFQGLILFFLLAADFFVNHKIVVRRTA